MIGARILEMRQKLGWSQSQLAKELDVNVKTVKNWENEVSDPSVKNIVRLTQLFSVTADYLMGIDNQTVIAIRALSKKDQICLRAMCQVFIDNATDTLQT